MSVAGSHRHDATGHDDNGRGTVPSGDNHQDVPSITTYTSTSDGGDVHDGELVAACTSTIATPHPTTDRATGVEVKSSRSSAAPPRARIQTAVQKTPAQHANCRRRYPPAIAVFDFYTLWRNVTVGNRDIVDHGRHRHLPDSYHRGVMIIRSTVLLPAVTAPTKRPGGRFVVTRNSSSGGWQLTTGDEPD